MHRYIPSRNIIDANFPMQVTSGAVAGAALNTNQISRFQLLPDGHVDFGQMPKIHIVGSAADTNHNTLAKTFLRKRCTLPSSTNNRTVNRAIDAFVSNAHEIISLVICTVCSQVSVCLRHSESALIRRNQKIHLYSKQKSRADHQHGFSQHFIASYSACRIALCSP